MGKMNLGMRLLCLAAVVLGVAGCGDDDTCLTGAQRACASRNCFGFQQCTDGVWGPCETRACEDASVGVDAASVVDGGESDAGASDAGGDVGTDAGTSDAGVPMPEGPPLSPHTVEVGGWDCADPTAVLIDSADDLGMLNDSSARIFCVAPGDYLSAGHIRLTASGSEGAPRILALYDPSSTERVHPVDAEPEERARFQSISLDGASHWVVDRLSFEMEDDTEGNYLRNGSTDNVFNMILVDDYQRTGFGIRTGCHRNVLQNSVLRNGPRGVGDRVAVILAAEYRSATVTHGTMLLNNEIYDGTDSIQLMRSDLGTVPPAAIYSDFAGTIIENNDLYATPASHIDCESGESVCGWYENGLDIKAGSLDESRPVRVVGNRLWGWRKTNRERSRGSSSWGTALVVHQSAAYVEIRENVIFDSARGIGVLPNHGEGRLSVTGNIIADIPETPEDQGYAMVLFDGTGVEAYGNIIRDAHTWVSTSMGTNDLRCNVVLGSPAGNIGNASGDYNFYYDSPRAVAGSGNIVRSEVSEAAMEEFCFWRTIWTNPERHCLPGMQSTEASPHHGACDPMLGALAGYGIDDEPVSL